jgi:phytoene desaturase
MEKRRFDCVVIGSGIGGMTAAALMAHYGYSTLVAEKRPTLGGRFSTQVIDGFKCPTGALIIQRGTELEKTFTVTGAKFDIVDCTDISLKIGENMYPLLGEGVGSTVLTALRKLRWRHYRFGLQGLWMTLRAMGRLSWRSVLSRVGSGGPIAQRARSTSKRSYREWMERHTDDPRIIEVHHALVSSLFSATNDFECPAEDVFEFFAGMARPTKLHRFGYAPRGNIELIEELARVVRRRGGEVLEEAEVETIRVEDGRAKGVVMALGGTHVQVDARVVISNAGPRQTAEMVGEGALPDWYMRRIKEVLRPVPIVMGLIESDVPLLDKRGLVVVSGTKAIVTGVTLTLVSREVGPPGRHLLWTCGTPATCSSHIDRDFEIARNEEDLKTAFPLFKTHGRVLKWVVKDIDDDLPCMRTRPGHDMPVETPIPNLFNVGDGVKDPGWTGSPACARSAWKVVDTVRRAFPPPALRDGHNGK